MDLLNRERAGLSREPDSPPDPGAARRELAGKVAGTLAEDRRSHPRTVRVSVRVGARDPFYWLGTRSGPRVYWSGRDDGVEVAAAGIADLHCGEFAKVGKSLSGALAVAGPGVRYFGGMAFDPERAPDDGWAAFGACRFALPRLELRRSGGVSELACNLVLPRDAENADEVLAEIEESGLAVGSPSRLPAVIGREDRPGPEGWARNAEAALDAFRRGRLEKVVLARRTGFLLPAATDPLLLARRLRDESPGCFHFLFEPERGTAFLGASPERLYRREGRGIFSEAVAGTRPRGESETEDARLRAELLRSAKDRAEHDYVRESIREALGPLCEELEVAEKVSEMKLATRRHLVSRVRGLLRPGVGDADVLAALHPTPAVGGLPRGDALSEIRDLEPFDRGWYAGPVGWVGRDCAEFAVGIRSGLVRGWSIALYSGAGIVPGSTPEGEWMEIEQKIEDFTRILGIEPGSLHAAS
jgi:menaquinone-specific isochorismate synthase